MNKEYDVIIVGAGIVGLTLAAALIKNKFTVAVIDTQKIFIREKSSIGPEILAINMASQRILDRLNAWPFMRTTHYSALRKIVAWDSIGSAQIELDSKTLGRSELGFIVDADEIRDSIYKTIKDTDIDFFAQANPKFIINHTDHISLQLDDECIHAQLIVGADGAHSWVREQTQLTFSHYPYHQEAIIGIVDSERPHQKTAYQHFLSSGPVGLLPLNNSNQMTLIWSANLETATALMNMNEEDFNGKLTTVFKKYLGNLRLHSLRKNIPLCEQHTPRMIKERVALIGDAAHRIHPLAGQGVNLGFLDAACLAEILQQAKQQSRDLGNLKILRRYERWRKLDNDFMRWTTRGFKELFGAQSSCLIQARSLGMNTTNRLTFLKKYIMNYASGNREDLPSLAQQ